MYEEIRVKTLLNNFYRGFGQDPTHRGGKCNPESINSIELVARRKAYRALASSDRVKLRKCINNFRDKTGMGEDTALMLIMRLGIFLDACEKRTNE